jgi:two-component system, OmpR family, sensor histidine kinase MtrB
MSTRLQSPRRFRRRLTIVCILVAGLSGGFLAVTSYFGARAYRNQTFMHQAVRRADLALLALADNSDPAAVNAALAPYRARGNFETVVVRDGTVYSSAQSLEHAVPQSVRSGVAENSQPFSARVHGTPYVVVARPGVDEQSKIFFFFSEANITDSLRQFRNVLAFAWVLTLAIAAGFGALVAKGALRPIRRAARESTATTNRLLGPVALQANDEFEQWVDSFNGLVEALELKVVELSEAAERERRFTSDVAHELRTPLTALTSSAALLEDHLVELPLGARRPAELLITEVQRLRRLVIELLELARLDAGAEPVHVEPLEIATALRVALQPWEGRAQFSVEVEPGLGAWADRLRFKRVVDNLVENAIRHGGAVVTVQAFRRADRTCIEVTDAGPGVAAADASRIFERFYKGDPSRAGHGSGLGLAIAAKNAEAMDGTLVLANPGERGARFVFALRTADAQPTSSHGAAGPATPVFDRSSPGRSAEVGAAHRGAAPIASASSTSPSGGTSRPR